VNNTENREFVEEMKSLAAYYNQTALSPLVLGIYLDGLADYTLEQVRYGLGMHLKGSTGQFLPKVADILRVFNAPPVTAEDVVAAARATIKGYEREESTPTNPFGVLCAIYLGTHDMNNMNSYDLKLKAKEVLLVLPDWMNKQAKGIYTDHEILTLIKYDVPLCAPFMPNLTPPVNHEELLEQKGRVMSSEKYLALEAERRHKRDENVISIEGQNKFKQLVNDIKEG